MNLGPPLLLIQHRPHKASGRADTLRFNTYILTAVETLRLSPPAKLRRCLCYPLQHTQDDAIPELPMT